MIFKRMIACAITVALLAGSTLTASAAQQGSKNALTGANITVMDTTTPAAAFGFKGDTARFRSADNKILGTMPVSDMNAIIKRVSVNGLPPGNWPQLTGMEWSIWFSGEFNKLRGLGNGTRQAATAPERFTDEWIEIEIAKLIRLVNAEREKAGMHRLEVCDDLMEFAMIRAHELGETGLTHVRPNGVRVTNEVATTANAAGRSFERWMNSPPHRRAILGEGGFKVWNKMGVAVYRYGSIIVFER